MVLWHASWSRKYHLSCNRGHSLMLLVHNYLASVLPCSMPCQLPARTFALSDECALMSGSVAFRSSLHIIKDTLAMSDVSCVQWQGAVSH